MTNATNTSPLQIGESRPFSAGPEYLLYVTRTATGYVVEAQRNNHPLPCYTSTFDAGNVPADLTPRKAAFVYMASLYRDFTGTVEALPDELYGILQAIACNGGSITPQRGCTPEQLRALHGKGFVTLEYKPGTTRIRRATINAAGINQLNAEAADRRRRTVAAS